MAPASLVEVDTLTRPVGSSRFRRQRVLRTPSVELEIHRENNRLVAKGEDQRAVVLELPRAPSLPMLKRGIQGRSGERPLRIHRPHYGLRRRDRTVLIEWDGWLTFYWSL